MGNSSNMEQNQNESLKSIRTESRSKRITKGFINSNENEQPHQTCMSDQDDDAELCDEDDGSQRLQTEQFNDTRLHSRKERQKNSKECSRQINKHFSSLLRDEHLAAFCIQSYFRNWLISKYEKEMTMKMVKPKIIIYGSSISVNSKAKSDYEHCLDLLNSVGIQFENRDLHYEKLYVVETYPYGGPNKLPIIVVNDIYIGGLEELSDLIDQKYFRCIAYQEYISRCLKCQASRINNDSAYCVNCWEKIFFFSKPAVEYSPDLFANSKIKTHNKSFDLGMGNQDSMNFHYHTQRVDFNTSNVMERTKTFHEEKKDLNKSQMIIDKNILDEFLENDNTFRDSTDNKQSLSFANYKPKTFK